MTYDPGAAGRAGGEQPDRSLRCPSCLDEIPLDWTQLYLPEPGTNTLVPWNPGSESNPLRQRDMISRAQVKCPNETPRAHFLPAPLFLYDRPLTIAFVGQAGTGKTHLLAAMMTEIGRNGLSDIGMRYRSINIDKHHEFVAETVENITAGWAVPATPTTDFPEFTDALLVTVGGRTRPVMFFDISGESLVDRGPLTEFLLGVDALIFVVDPLRALRLRQLAPVRVQQGIREDLVGVGDRTFSAVIGRQERGPDGLSDLPVAVVLNKCDLLRFEPPVDRWLRREVRALPDQDEVYRESRDVFAFLAAGGGDEWLAPVREFRRCTLHFASATGGSPTPKERPLPDGNRRVQLNFVSGVRPRRVLGPLMSVFSMCGLLDPADPPRLKGVV